MKSIPLLKKQSEKSSLACNSFYNQNMVVLSILFIGNKSWSVLLFDYDWVFSVRLSDIIGQNQTQQNIHNLTVLWHSATDATWSKWVALIIQWARIGNPDHPGTLEVIMDWPEGKDFGISPEEEVTRAEEAPLYNKLPENEKQYALFTDGSCCIVGKLQRWKAAVWSPQDIAAQVENLVVKVRHVDAHVPNSRATEEHENKQQVDQASLIEVA
ncbi:hypothetical protein QYF61_016751 [Mycteria americana]|uniref:RNase H type-1 domain-containing protein n=1 Tax=Mycteria americana TaxID=33587 RepID=A0AAN7NUN2_MYCAM|nr:hypothetical protein QYF61_016751 [Mycteria americana]